MNAARRWGWLLLAVLLAGALLAGPCASRRRRPEIRPPEPAPAMP